MPPNDEPLTPASDNPMPIGRVYDITINENEGQVLLMALGELLQSVERTEHLTPTIQALIDRIQRAVPAE